MSSNRSESPIVLSSHEHACICVCVCVYLLSCSMQGLTYTRVVLSLFIFVQFFLSLFLHSLPLSPLPSVHFKYLYFSGESCTFLSFKQIRFCNFFSL